jgi:GTPase SAR1 family protein
VIEGKPISLSIWDTNSFHESECVHHHAPPTVPTVFQLSLQFIWQIDKELRTLSYANTDVFIICYSVSDYSSFLSVFDRYVSALGWPLCC